MSWVATAVVGGSVISGVLGSRSAGRAADAQVSSNQAAIEEQRRQFDEIMRLTQPQRQIGNQAMNAIASLLGLSGSTPQDNATQGMIGGQPIVGVRGGRGGRDMNFIRGLAGGGGAGTGGGGMAGGTDFDAEGALANLPGNEVIVNDMMRRIRQSSPTTGGNVLTALADRVGGFQSDRLFNSLFQLAGFGPSGTSMATQGAMSSGNAISNLMQSSGLANASGIMGEGSSINSGIQNILQWFMMKNILGGAGGGGGGVLGPPM